MRQVFFPFQFEPWAWQLNSTENISVLGENKLLNLRKADWRNFLPEHRSRRCSRVTGYRWILLVSSQRREGIYRPIKPSWNDWPKGFVGLLTFNKRLFFTCCQSCVWRWGRTVNSTLKKTLWNKSDCPHTWNVKATVSNLSFRRNKLRPL